MQNLYGGKASARPRSLPYGGEGNFARIRPKESADAGNVLRTPSVSVSGALIHALRVT